jgi:hypothetical protein
MSLVHDVVCVAGFDQLFVDGTRLRRLTRSILNGEEAGAIRIKLLKLRKASLQFTAVKVR